MMKKIYIALIIFSGIIFAQDGFSELGGMPGAFSRMGFGARGMGMGNAMSAVNEGNIVSYYNPALIPFQIGNSFQTSYSFLSLDRSLNFLNFTRRFELGKKTDPDGTVGPRSVAGVSAGIINSGVSKIDARDNQGNKTGDLSTSENQFFVAVANRFSERLSVGIAFKFYYYKLYENLSTTGFGFDIGALYSLNENINLSFMLTDINSKYEWDSGKIFGSAGKISKDRFPLMKKVGLSYKFKEEKIIAAVEYENAGSEVNFLRGGAEYGIYENLFFRLGVDKINLSNFNSPMRPSAGFSYFYSLSSLKVGFDYAFVFEPYSPGDEHIIGINITF